MQEAWRPHASGVSVDMICRLARSDASYSTIVRRSPFCRCSLVFLLCVALLLLGMSMCILMLSDI